MIRNENEYREAVQRSRDEQNRLAEHAKHLEGLGLTDEQVARALEPLKSFHMQLEEEVASYERLKRGDLGELQNLHGLGLALIGLRIALGLTQRELAERLDVSETQVSRDERNEYRGITVERASRILDVLNADLRSTFQPLSPSGLDDAA